MRRQGDAAPPPADPPPPPRDGGGRGGRRLFRAEGVARDDQLVGHREGQGLVGGARSVQAFEVPEPRRARFQGEQLRLHSVRVGSEVLPRDAAGSLRAGDGGGPPAPLLHLGAARWDEAE